MITVNNALSIEQNFDYGNGYGIEILYDEEYGKLCKIGNK